MKIELTPELVKAVIRLNDCCEDLVNLIADQVNDQVNNRKPDAEFVLIRKQKKHKKKA